jgi:hypothetical protein
LRYEGLIGGTGHKADGHGCCGNGAEQRLAQTLDDIVVHILFIFSSVIHYKLP